MEQLGNQQQAARNVIKYTIKTPLVISKATKRL